MVLDEPRLPGGIGGAQLRRVGDGLQMGDRRPYARYLGIRPFQRQPRVGKIGRLGRNDPRHDRAVIG
ncbi:hypothetical protein ACRAWD_02420 [Caulobacter segnis]